jgi:3-oxoacyl-[acyl-carrier-protein] synthase III
MRVKVVATGMYLPPTVQTAEDLAPLVGKDAAWILEHTGVARRHLSTEPMEVMAAKAAREAIGNGPGPDLVINASTTPRQTIPDSSVYIARELGYEGVSCFSIHATCLSFPVALQTAATFVHAGVFQRVLVVSAEVGSIARNFEEPESAVLLGDGAGAVLVEPTPEGESSEFIGFSMLTWPSGAELTELPGGGIRKHPNNPATRPADNLFHMDGPAVYRMARRRAFVVLRTLFDKAGLSAKDIDLVVPHQASGRAMDAVTSYGLPAEKIVNVVGEYGNCIAASIPMALATADRDGRLHRGDTILLAGTGAGLSVAGLLLRW